MISRKSALIVTSSEAFPRSTPEIVGFDQTYVSLLRKEYPQIDFHHYNKNGHLKIFGKLKNSFSV